MQNTLDMTDGSPRKLLLSLALPTIATNILQQLYNVADSAVVGQMLGTESFTSVSMAGWMYWLCVSMLIGLSHGFSVYLAQRVGAGDGAGTSKSLASASYLLAFAALLLTLLGLLFIRDMLHLLNTPENLIDGTIVYLRFLFAGLLVTAAYNLLASTLQALGDSKSPFVAIVFATLLNIALNILFISAFSMGVAGVAIATVLSQIAACVLCTIAVFQKHTIRPTRRDWRPDRKIMSRVLSLASPLALRNGILSFSTLVIQFVINGYGYLFVAGVMAAKQLTAFATQVGEGFDVAVSTFVGQNVGAQKPERIRHGVKTALVIALVFALALALVIPTIGVYALRLFITDGSGIEDALAYGTRYLQVMSGTLFLLFVAQVFRAALEGLGDTVTPLLASFVELMVSILAIFLLPMAFGSLGVYFALPISWLFAGMLLMISYLIRMQPLRLL